VSFKDLYSDSDRILIVGPYPPPLGGISVFIYRLKKYLEYNKFHVEVFDTARNYRIFGFKFIAFFFKIIFNNYQVIHIQSFDLKRVYLLFLVRFFKRFKIYFTNHNATLFDTKNKMLLFSYKKLIPGLDLLILVNDHILEIYKKQKVVLPGKYIIKNTFLPPPVEEEENILRSYPKELFDFLDNHSPVLLSNAFQIILLDNIDLYGLDLCVDLIKNLKVHFHHIGFIFALANAEKNEAYFQKIRSEIADNSLTENFYFLTGQKELWPLFKRSDLFIRATYKDGYGISVDESLYFKCPAIASNVCKRHPDAVLFENRNAEDLFEKSLGILKTKTE
jgi:glycosyltransferase involved in cell wall biosynthesis